MHMHVRMCAHPWMHVIVSWMVQWLRAAPLDDIRLVRRDVVQAAREANAFALHASCHVITCHAMPCHAMPYHAMPYHAMPCHAMPYHAMPCHAMPCASMRHAMASS